MITASIMKELILVVKFGNDSLYGLKTRIYSSQPVSYIQNQPAYFFDL